MKHLIAITGLLLGIWILLFIWVQKPFHLVIWSALMLMVVLWLGVFVFGVYKGNLKTVTLTHLGVFAVVLVWFFSLPPKNDRLWNDEVAHNVDYEQHGDIITVHHVRNFHWHTLDDYEVRWESRQYDLNKLNSLDFIVSTWGMEAIAHTLLSFGFEDGQRLAFSIEIRKEADETFSSLDGFFRQYELAFIASDERDVIFTRTNIRTDETTHIYPIKLSKSSAQALFLSYLKRGKALQTKPEWYNSFTANCTTVIYDMVKHIEPAPFDYRVIASGYLPEYLYEHGAIDNRHSLQTWKNISHIQPKTADYHTWADKSSQAYSQAIRQGLPSDGSSLSD